MLIFKVSQDTLLLIFEARWNELTVLEVDHTQNKLLQKHDVFTWNMECNPECLWLLSFRIHFIQVWSYIIVYFLLLCENQDSHLFKTVLFSWCVHQLLLLYLSIPLCCSVRINSMNGKLMYVDQYSAMNYN